MSKDHNYLPIRAILERVKQVHLQAAECCEQTVYASDDRPALFAGLFRYQQEILDNYLTLPNEEETELALATWVQYVPLRQVEEALQSLQTASRDNLAAIAERSLDLQREIVEFLRQLGENLHGTPASRFLSQLADNLEANQKTALQR